MHEDVFLVRHGHVEGIDRPHFRGRQHLQLTAAGVQQAEQTAAYLHRVARIDLVVSSPLTRCVTTAAVIGQPLGLAPVPDEGLIDRDYGDWQGRSFDEVRTDDPAGAAAWQADPTADIPNSEAMRALADRAGAAFDQLVAKHAGRCMVLVAHDTINRALLLRALGLGLDHYRCLRQSPGAVSRLQHDGERWVVESMNQTAHLIPARSRAG